MSKVAMILGGGGFIAGHLALRLKSEGYYVIGVDIKPHEEWWRGQLVYDKCWSMLDVRDMNASDYSNVDEVYNLACDMGGMGFIEFNRIETMNSVDINMKALTASHTAGVPLYFYSSSACVYPDIAEPLSEDKAWPAQPDSPYGLEKLFNEVYCAEFAKQFCHPGIRVARFHNVYGPYGTWKGGREKAPAAIARKVAVARMKGDDFIEVWSNATRSYLYVVDAVRGVRDLMNSAHTKPVNIGSEIPVTVTDLARSLDWEGEVRVTGDGPRGVASRCSKNSWFIESTPLRHGMKETYDWIVEQIRVG